MIPTPRTQNLEPSTQNPEVPVYCDCCPHRPKKMAVIQPDAIQIISRRSGKKHIVRIPISHIRHSHEKPPQGPHKGIPDISHFERSQPRPVIPNEA